MINIHQFEAGNLLNQLIHSLSGVTRITHAFSVTPFVLIGILLIALAVLRRVLTIKNSLKEHSILLELTPPSFTEQESYTTNQLFSLIHSLGSQRTFKDRLLGNKTRFSLEIVSSQDQGIRYLIRTAPEQVNTLRRSLLSYLPHLTVKATNEYIPQNTATLKKYFYKTLEFKQSGNFAFPLRGQDELYKHDPIAYITGMMTKLSPSELVSLQIVLTPTKPARIKKISKIISSNGDLIKYLRTPGFLKGILFNALRAPHTKSQSEEEMVKLVDSKINQPLFESTIRLLMVFKDKDDLRERQSGLKSSFSSFSSSHYQGIIPKKYPDTDKIKEHLFYMFKKRVLSFTKTSIFSISEISDIYHFPYTSMTKTEDLVKTHSKELPATLSLKKDDKDIIFAKNSYGGKTVPIGLTKEERDRHMYILGATGTGKSTLLLSMISQDIANNKGFCVIDPHGDLIEKILPSIPEKRLKDVIYFNPDDIGYPMGLNLLELSEGLSEEDQLREKEFITESIISLFHKLYPEKYSGPRMEYILRNTIHTAFTVKGATLFTVYKLLTNTPFRKTVTNQLTDDNLKDFWKYEFNKAGDYQKVKMISPITNKIGRFLFSPTAKRILEQQKSTINFDTVMDEGKILLCNLSKGRIGEDNSEVFGILVMTKVQLSALKRARIDVSKRKDFYLYVDEFQNFATPAFAQILSEARKYKLAAILAHQTTSQLEDKDLVNITLANTGTVICFRTANPEDEKLILPQFYPYIKQGEIASLPVFHFYMKINAINPEEPFSGETVPISLSINKKIADEVIKLSRENYATKYSALETDTKSIKTSSVTTEITNPTLQPAIH